LRSIASALGPGLRAARFGGALRRRHGFLCFREVGGALFLALDCSDASLT
jgi:hypothetical protein